MNEKLNKAKEFIKEHDAEIVLTITAIIGGGLVGGFTYTMGYKDGYVKCFADIVNAVKNLES